MRSRGMGGWWCGVPCVRCAGLHVPRRDAQRRHGLQDILLEHPVIARAWSSGSREGFHLVRVLGHGHADVKFLIANLAKLSVHRGGQARRDDAAQVPRRRRKRATARPRDHRPPRSGTGRADHGWAGCPSRLLRCRLGALRTARGSGAVAKPAIRRARPSPRTTGPHIFAFGIRSTGTLGSLPPLPRAAARRVRTVLPRSATGFPTTTVSSRSRMSSKNVRR